MKRLQFGFRGLSLGLFQATLFSCATVNSDPNILSQKPFSEVRYVREIPQGVTSTPISVVVSGYRANILNSIPDLYLEARKLKQPNKLVCISNIKLRNSVRRKPFQVPYQDCKTEYYTESQPDYSCTGYGQNQRCATTYKTVQKSRQKCDTKYRTEIKDVLYQAASADVFHLTADNLEAKKGALE